MIEFINCNRVSRKPLTGTCYGVPAPPLSQKVKKSPFAMSSWDHYHLTPLNPPKYFWLEGPCTGSQ